MIRTKKGWRQADLATRAGVSRWVVMRIERGRIAGVPVAKVRRVAAALDARVDMVVRWQGGDLGRLVSARHAAMHEVMARFFASRPSWRVEPEVSFSIWGERGAIDILAWHAATRTVLVIELKTELVDLNELLGTLDRKRRLAGRVASERGWDAASVGVWVVIADSRTNRRAVATHSLVIRNKLPTDGRGVAKWVGQPIGGCAALSFLPHVHRAHLERETAATKRVVRARPRPSQRPSNAE